MSIADDEKRVAQVLGIKEGEELPDVSEDYLCSLTRFSQTSYIPIA